jgi:flagellar protein FlgJ
MNVNPLPKAVNASDIAPERLAGNTALSEQQKIAEASRQFEAILLRQILESSQKAVIPSRFTDNSTASSIYRDMITTQLADSISKSGTLGFAKTFEQQLTRPDLGAGAGTSPSPGKAHSRKLQAGTKTSPPLSNRLHKRPDL